MANRDIVVIGGSSGATSPLKAILGSLPPDFSAAVFVVLHIPARSLGMLNTVATAAGQLPVRAAADGMPIEPGNVYLAVPDRHLILADGHLVLGRGPRENMSRPAIDPLFRSAAAAYGPRVIGVVLSGLLNDGSAGLEAIKRCGGFTIVQDPRDAVADEMPRSAMEALTVDLSVPGARIGDVLADLVNERAGPKVSVPPDIRLEVDIAAGERVNSPILREIAQPVPLTCPDCGGTLSLVADGGVLRFRCQVGHGYTADVLATEQERSVDEALRVALRIIEERAELVQRMAADAEHSARPVVAEMYKERAAEYRRYADTIRDAVIRSLPSSAPTVGEGGQTGQK